MWLLDTNAWIVYLNATSSSIYEKIQQIDINEIFICDTVKSELYYGAYKSQRVEQNLQRIEQLFEIVPSLDFDQTTAKITGEVRASLARQGTPIGMYDAQIAAIALQYQMVLVTHNVKEFCRVPDLKLEDWQ